MPRTISRTDSKLLKKMPSLTALDLLEQSFRVVW